MGNEYRPETLQEQLLRVQKAIAKIESGVQSYHIGNRNITRADLKTLYDRENQLKATIAAEENGGMLLTFAQMGTD